MEQFIIYATILMIMHNIYTLISGKIIQLLSIIKLGIIVYMFYNWLFLYPIFFTLNVILSIFVVHNKYNISIINQSKKEIEEILKTAKNPIPYFIINCIIYFSFLIKETIVLDYINSLFTSL